MRVNNFLVLGIISWVVFVACLLCIICGVVTEHYNGIAVDSRNYLYIGCYNDIRVYFNGENLYDIVAKSTPSGSYNFTIENDCIVIYKQQKVFYYTLDGLLIREEDDSEMHQSISAYAKRNEFFSNGNKYILKSFLGREYVVKIDDKSVQSTVFKMPMLDYCVKVIQPISMFAFFAFAFLYLKSKGIPEKIGEHRGRFCV